MIQDRATCSIYKQHNDRKDSGIDPKGLFGGLLWGVRGPTFSRVGFMDRLQAVLATKFADRLTFRLQQSHLAGTCDRFSAPLNLEFAKDFLDVPFHRVPGEEEALANLTVREPLGNEL